MATVSNIYWTSSSPVFSQALYLGPSTVGVPAPDYQFLTRAGVNGTDSGDVDERWEQSLTVPTPGGPDTTKERCPLDSLHGVPGPRPFNSIFQFRFVVTQQKVLASAGTTSFIDKTPAPFTSIDRIRLSARVRNAGQEPVAHREVSWESAEIVLRYDSNVPNENREFYYLTALPRATSPQRRKLSSTADKDLQQGDHFEQYLDLTGKGVPKFVGFELVALITFRANDPAFPQETFGPDDLQVKVAAWVTATAPAT